MTPTHYLRPLFAPESVAVIGASARLGSLGRIVYENMLATQFRGELYAINPNHATVLGERSYAALAAIGRPVDLAVICAPPATVPSIIAEGRGRMRTVALLSGAPTAKAAEYRRWRQELAASAKVAGVRVLGPASFGVIRSSIGLNATFGTMSALPGRLTLISQSGAVCSALLDFARTTGIGFASVVALGAASDIDFGELLEFALADPDTDGIVLYVETIRVARAFLSALRAAARVKPVIVLKAGRHAEPVTHGAPTPDQAFDAALKRAGTVRVRSYTQLFAAARILAYAELRRSNRLAIVTNGRGPGLLAADRAMDTGVMLATLSVETLAALRNVLPPAVEPANPLDVQGEASPQMFADAVRRTLADANVDAVLALHVAVPAAAATDTARAVATVARDADKPVLAAWLGAVDRPEARKALEAGGIANFYTPENAVEAFSFLAAYRRNQEWLLEVPPPQAELAMPDLAAAAAVREQVLAAGRSTVAATETQALLSAFGIKIAPVIAVSTAEEAIAAARRVGYPVALGFDAQDASAPQANLRNGSMLSRAFASLRDELGKRLTTASSTVIVRKVIKLREAREGKIGVYPDPTFGPIVAFGGPAARERDLSLMLPPLNRRLAIDLIAGSHEAPPPPTIDPLVELLLEVSSLVCALPWVIELDLDPVQFNAGGAMVGRARATVDGKRPATPDGYRHMAIHPYPVELETTLTLNDLHLRVRPIRPEDAAMERAFVAGLSDESRYLRFMQHLSALTPQMLARFTQVDYDRELALIAIEGVPGQEAMVGVARYVANPDAESAEFAVTVADAWHGRGLGRALMQMLIERAKKRGFLRLMGVVLAVNAPMLRLASSLGFHAKRDPDDLEQVIVTLQLREPK